MNARPTDRLAIAVAQLNPIVGDIAGNADRARRARAQAARDGADLVVLPELFLSGYPPEDLVLKPALQAACRAKIEELARETGDGAVCTSGGLVCRPGIVTSVVETAEQLLDQRHLDAATLASMLAAAQEASQRFADEERLEVEWERIWSIEPILFDETLVGFAEEAVAEVAGSGHRLPSGPLHDAAEVSRAGVPTVMVFVQSLRGLSHTKLEDTKPEHLELAVAALDRLASKTIAWVAGG